MSKTSQQVIAKIKILFQIGIPVIALVVSLRACLIAQTSLIVSNRPYLDILPLNFKDDNVAVLVTRKNDDLVVTTYVKISNLGKVPAKPIQPYGHHEILLGRKRLKSSFEESIPESSLAPGASFRVVYASHFSPPQGISIEQFTKEVRETMERGEALFPCVAGVRYSSDLEPGKSHLTEYAYDVNIEKHRIRKTRRE